MEVEPKGSPQNVNPSQPEPPTNQDLASQIRRSAQAFSKALSKGWNRLSRMSSQTSKGKIPTTPQAQSLEENNEHIKEKIITNLPPKDLSEPSIKDDSSISKPEENKPQLTKSKSAGNLNKQKTISFRNLVRRLSDKSLSENQPTKTASASDVKKPMMKRASERFFGRTEPIKQPVRTESIKSLAIDLTQIPEDIRITNAKNFIAEIRENGTKAEGIFRLDGNKEIVDLFLSKLTENTQDVKNLSLNEQATALKRLIGSLEYISDEQKADYLNIGRDTESTEEVKIAKLKDLFKNLKPEKAEILKELCEVCNSIAENFQVTLMAESNLAVAPGTTLFKMSQGLDGLSESSASQPVFILLLKHYKDILP